MFITIDRHVLSVAENFAHFCQRNFGFKPISISAAGFVLCACTLISGWFIPGVVVSTAGKVHDGLLLIAIFLVTIVVYPDLEKKIERDMSKGLSNRLKISPIGRFARIFILILSVLHLLTLFVDVSLKNLNYFLQGFGLLASVYFIACDPLPPGPSRLRKLLESMMSRTSVVRN